jgi:hypothetical protein
MAFDPVARVRMRTKTIAGAQPAAGARLPLPRAARDMI